LLVDWVLVFGKSFISKDESLRKKKGADEYFNQSNMLFPRIFDNTILDYIGWTFIFSAYALLINQAGGLNLCSI